MKNLILLTLIGFIVFMATGVVGPITSLYYESLGANYAAIGVLGTVMWLSSILFSYLWGRATDRLGRRKPFLVIGLLILSLTDLAIAWVTYYGYLFPLRAVAAAAQAAYNVTALALIGDMLERRQVHRGRYMGFYRGAGSLGFGLMAFVSGSLADRVSLSFPFVLASACLGVAGVLALFIREASPQTLSNVLSRSSASFPDNSPSTAQAAALPLLPLLISAFVWSLVTGAVYAVWANYMVDQVGYGRAAMSRLWSLASSSEFPLMIVAGWLSDRIGRLPMLSLSLVAWTLVFVGYIVTPHMPWILIVQLMRGFAYSAFTATAMTYAAEVRDKSQRGRVSGLYGTAGGVGSILGSAMGGGITQWLGFGPMIGISATLTMVGAIYSGIEAGRHRRIIANHRRPMQ